MDDFTPLFFVINVMIGTHHHPVGTEFRVDVSLDGRGDRLGLRARKNKRNHSQSSRSSSFLSSSPNPIYNFSVGRFTTQHTPPPRRNPLKDLHPSRAGEHIFTTARARAPRARVHAAPRRVRAVNARA